MEMLVISSRHVCGNAGFYLNPNITACYFFKLAAQLSLQEESERSKPESGNTGFKTEATNAQLSTESYSCKTFDPQM